MTFFKTASIVWAVIDVGMIAALLYTFSNCIARQWKPTSLLPSAPKESPYWPTYRWAIIWAVWSLGGAVFLEFFR